MGTSIPKCGMVMGSERITADVWSALEVNEGRKPVVGNTLGGVKALAHQGVGLEAGAVPDVGAREVKWKSMWDEVIYGISDGLKMGTKDAKKLVQLKKKAVKHAAVWQAHTGEQLASDRGFQQKYTQEHSSVGVYSLGGS